MLLKLFFKLCSASLVFPTQLRNMRHHTRTMLRRYLVLELFMANLDQSKLVWIEPHKMQKRKLPSHLARPIWVKVSQAYLLSGGPADEEVSLLHTLGLQIIHSHHVVPVVKQTPQSVRTSPLWNAVEGRQERKHTGYPVTAVAGQDCVYGAALWKWHTPSVLL